MNADRRARLPGADELFRSTASSRREDDESPPPADIDVSALNALAERAAEEYGIPVLGDVPPGGRAATLAVGSLLSWTASCLQAKHVVEIGGDGGGLGLWLLRGMSPGGVLTTISPDEQVYASGRAAFDQDGVTDRVRAILGEPGEVLPRLSDDSYDIVVWAAGLDRPREARDHALRLLRVGGVLVVLDVARESVADVRVRRSLVRDVIEDPQWQVAVLPVDGGLVLARRR